MKKELTNLTKKSNEYHINITDECQYPNGQIYVTVNDTKMQKELADLLVKNRERVSNAYASGLSLDNTTNTVSKVTESFNKLTSEINLYDLRTDFSFIKNICNTPISDELYRVLVPHVSKCKGVSYLSIKLAYVSLLISVIGIIKSNKNINVITRNETDSLLLHKGLEELRLGYKISTTNQGVCLGKNCMIEEYKYIVNSVNIYHSSQEELLKAYNNINIDDIFIDCTETKEIKIYSSGYCFNNNIIDKGYATISMKKEDILVPPNDHIKYTIYNIIKNIITINRSYNNTINTPFKIYFVNIAHNDYLYIRNVLKTFDNLDLDIDLNIDHIDSFAYQVEDIGSAKYKGYVTTIAHNLGGYALFIDGNGAVVYGSNKAYALQYLVDESEKRIDYKSKLENYMEDLKKEELNPENIDLMYKIISILKEL